jgi:glutamyl-tRNA reductase
MQLFAFGVNHQTAPLDVRERVAFNTEGLPVALRDLVNHEPVREAAIISTCNRTEVYCSTPEPSTAIRWLARYHKLKESLLEPCLYMLPHERAVKHAFRVASGLDSMVLGEPQILGQMKDAVRSAEEAGTLGLILHKLFQQTFSVAKLVRSQTEIGAASVSMAAAAVRLAERIYPSISQQKVLLIGAGEMIELCAAHFAAQRPSAMTFTNRTLERAQELARRFEGGSQSLTDLPDFIAHYDIVVSCTASQLPIIGKGLVERALKARRHRPVLMIDLAVPRDIEATIGALEHVYLYNLDDLQEVVSKTQSLRTEAVAAARAMLAEHVEQFVHSQRAREMGPLIDATAVDTSLLGHSYYGDSRSILADMFDLIRRGSPTAAVVFSTLYKVKGRSSRRGRERLRDSRQPFELRRRHPA